MVSHARDEVARLADRLLLMHQGRVTGTGECHQTINRIDDTCTNKQYLSALDGITGQHDSDYGLTEIHVDQHIFQAGLLDKPEGTPVRVVISAGEVSLASEPLLTTSMQNCLPVYISSVRKQGNHHALLTLDLGEQELVSQITRKSLDRLELSAGTSVYACFKASPWKCSDYC